MNKETVILCKAEPRELYTIDIRIKNSIVVGTPISAMYRFERYNNHYTMWTQRDDLKWILKIKDEAKEFIQESGGIEAVVDEFCAYEYPSIYKDKSKTEIVVAWIRGLPLAMPCEHNHSIIKKMEKYGYKQNEEVHDYYEVFSVFIADTIFESTKRTYSYDWRKFTKKQTERNIEE